MKKSQTVAVCLLLCLSVTAQAQNEKSKLKITDAYIITGVNTQPQFSLSLADMKSLAPQSVLLQKDYSSYRSSSYNGYAGSGNVSLRVGLQSRKQPNRELQFGVSYGSGVQVSNYQSKEVTTRYDTFTSSQTGSQYFVDSIHGSYLSSYYNSDLLQLEASLIFRTDNAARWSFYGGLGAGLGTSLRATTSISSYKSKASTSGVSGGNNSFFYFNYVPEVSEEYKNKNVVNAAVYVPAGIDFRIGKNREFWQQMHLFTELRPSLQVINIPELDTRVTAAMQNSIGFRLHW